MNPFIKALIPGSLLVLPLSACMTATSPEPAPTAGFCAGPASAVCAFANAPLQLVAQIVTLPRRPYPFQPLAQELRFTDAGGQSWIAPKGILTDGASIPPAFVKIVGNPTDPMFRGAAAIHDSYCGIGNEDTPFYHTRDWRKTHRMFYEALRVGGTPERKAKTMYSAVYMGGPRWSLVRTAPTLSSRGEVVSSQSAYPGFDNPDLQHVPVERLQEAMTRLAAWIQAQNPTIPEIDRRADTEIAEILTEFPLVNRFEPTFDGGDRDYHESEYPGEDGYDGYDDYEGEYDPTTGGETTPPDTPEGSDVQN